MSQSAQADPHRYEKMYRDEQVAQGLPAATPWDIGGPQQVVKQLVALGAIKGEVLDPGTGPGHHAIYFASKGYSATGIDTSPTAIERAKENARLEGRDLADAELQKLPACAQSCPADAITFGDLADEQSLVSRLSKSPRVFRLLEHLGARPKVFYIARDRRQG